MFALYIRRPEFSAAAAASLIPRHRRRRRHRLDEIRQTLGCFRQCRNEITMLQYADARAQRQRSIILGLRYRNGMFVGHLNTEQELSSR